MGAVATRCDSASGMGPRPPIEGSAARAGEFDAICTYRDVYAEHSTGESELKDLDRDL